MKKINLLMIFALIVWIIAFFIIGWIWIPCSIIGFILLYLTIFLIDKIGK